VAVKIGVLALQGDFVEHASVLSQLGVAHGEVRLPADLQGLDGLIIPGGESTTIGKLAQDFQLIEPLREFGKSHAVWGTCAGAIFLSKDAGNDQPLLNLMDMRVARNAFGRQVDSFEIDLDLPFLSKIQADNPPFPAIFIRAPRIEQVNPPAEVLARLADGQVVAAQQGRWLATSFHPELSADTRFHRYFLEMVK
jgi:5'-phosphate synthase pdxT subunit